MGLPRWANYLLGILGALALTVTLVITFMHPPPEDLLSLALLFLFTGSASAAIGFAAHRLGAWRRLRSVSQTLTLGYLIAAALTFINVWITARLMFLNDHDLTLAGLLLLFAGSISVSFGYFLSTSLTQSLRDMVRATRRVREGDFAARVQVEGRDEVARLAEAFNAMTARLEAADREARTLDAARRDLVAWASHDLRTPLTSLRAMLDALADGVVTDPETVARYLRQSQNEIARMNALTDDLFELAQMDTGRLTLRCDAGSLSDLISDTLEAFTARARTKGLTLRGSVDAGVDPVWMASEKVSRVLQNLIENAMRHTPSGGEIHLRAEVQNGTVVVSLRDTGEGIAPEDLPRIFDRFYRGDAARSRNRAREGAEGSGAGLGLAIAKGLVEAHGGRIWAESAPGRGTVMKFTLPKSVKESVAGFASEPL
jgi:signal transduction histidine kinase